MESGNYMGEVLLNLHRFKKADAAWKQAEQIRDRHFPADHAWQAQLANNLGVAAFYLGRKLEAIEHFQTAKEIWDSTSTVPTNTKASLISNLAILQETVGDLGKAYEMLLEAEDLASQDSITNQQQLTVICGNISHILIELGDFERALFYAHRATHHGWASMDSLDPRMKIAYNNLAVASIPMRDTQTYRMAMHLWRSSAAASMPPDHPMFLFIQSNNANGLMRMGLAEASKSEFSKLRNMMSLSPPAKLRLFVLGSYFEHCLQRRDPDSFADFIGIYRKKTFSTSFDNPVPRVKHLADLAAYRWMQGELDSAAARIQEAVWAGSRNFEEPEFTKMPRLEQVYSFVGFESVCYRKALIARSLWERNPQDRSQLEYALELLEFGMAVDLRNRSMQLHNRVGQEIRERRRRIHAMAIDVAFTLYRESGSEKWLHKALESMERGKAIRLQDALHDHRAQAYAGISDSLSEALSDIRIALHLQRELVRRAHESGNPQKVIEAEEKQVALLEEQDRIAEAIKSESPHYHALKFAPPLPDIPSELKRLEESGTVLLAFFSGPEKVYAVGAANGKIQAFAFPQATIGKAVRQFESSIKAKDFFLNRRDNYLRYSESAHAVYAEAVAPILEALDTEGADRLLVLPDGMFENLPFSALLTARPSSTYTDFKDLPYLLHEFHVSKAYSLSLQQRIRPKKAGMELSSALIYAPSADLEGAVLEVEELARQVDGELILNRAQGESKFYRLAPRYRLLHFATHGKTDLQAPLRAHVEIGETEEGGHDGLLHAYEVLGMELNAELVVLSACETGLGSDRSGEGPMSLVRAFRYAGCPSALMAMWEAPDRETSDIIRHFYKALSKGLPKDVALSEAKRHYLSHCEPDNAHPFFWAPIVLVGDRNPMEMGENGIGLPILLLLLAFIFFISFPLFRNS